MDNEDKKMELVFSPGCFDEFEGTQEELDEMIASIKAAFEDGTLLEDAEVLSEMDIDDLPDSVIEKLNMDFDDDGTPINPPNRTLN